MSDSENTKPAAEAPKPAAPVAAAKPAAAPAAETRKTAAPKTSAPAPETKEPKQESVAPAAKAEPAAASTTPYAAVSGNGADTIYYSAAKPAGRNGPRRSLTVYQVQRRLYELGFVEGYSETRYGVLTLRSVSQWQSDKGYETTGVLTREQFTELFKGDVNVDAVVDTPTDNAAE